MAHAELIYKLAWNQQVLANAVFGFACLQVFSAWMHLCAVRLFTESILRYGLPPSFLVMYIWYFCKDSHFLILQILMRIPLNLSSGSCAGTTIKKWKKSSFCSWSSCWGEGQVCFTNQNADFDFRDLLRITIHV